MGKNYTLYIYLRLACLLLLFSGIEQAHAGSQPVVFRQWNSMPSEKLLIMGHDFANDPEKPDSAMLALSIVTNRYDDGMSKSEKEEVAKALTYQSFVYIFRYYDYTKAYECLLRAQELAESIGSDIPSIYTNLGHIFTSIGDQSNDHKTMLRGLEYMRKSYRSSIKAGNHNLLNASFGNALTMAWKLDCIDNLKSDWEVFRKLKNNDAPEFTKFNIYYYHALENIRMKRYSEALAFFDDQIKLMRDDEIHVRYICLALFNKSQVYALMNDYSNAIAELMKCETFGRRYGLKDVNIDVFRQMSDYYLQTGDETNSLRYRNQFLALKDTLLNYQQVANMKELSFMSSLKKVNEKMENAKKERRRLLSVMGALVVFVFFISLVLYIFIKKNRELKSSYIALYHRTQEILKLEEENNTPKQEEKYKSSNLDEADKQQLYTQILHILQNSDEIFSAEFSLNRMAELVGSNYKKVSQVINEKANCNFNNLLNEYRVKEACKRMNNIEKYGNLTIEAISAGLGFKSRSTFLMAFKRVVGLAPSEYQRIRKNEEIFKKHQKNDKLGLKS